MNTRRHSGGLRRVVRAACIVAASTLAGCGQTITNGLTVRPLIVTNCPTDEQPEPATDLVRLDWGGGGTVLYPGAEFSPFELSAFALTGGGTLADHGEAFFDRVLESVSRILCETPDLLVRVENASEPSRTSAATVIRIVQEVAPLGTGRIGEAEYDPCNVHRDDEGIIYAEQMRRLARDYTLDQWVAMFANTIAHEIGHTLGYGHVTREQVPSDGRSLYVEIMLESHSLEELTREQRFLVNQDTCPNDLTTARRGDTVMVSCGGHLSDVSD